MDDITHKMQLLSHLKPDYEMSPFFVFYFLSVSSEVQLNTDNLCSRTPFELWLS